MVEMREIGWGLGEKRNDILWDIPVMKDGALC
jgi:hypothetical protein